MTVRQMAPKIREYVLADHEGYYPMTAVRLLKIAADRLRRDPEDETAGVILAAVVEERERAARGKRHRAPAGVDPGTGCTFTLPDWSGDDEPAGNVDFVTGHHDAGIKGCRPQEPAAVQRPEDVIDACRRDEAAVFPGAHAEVGEGCRSEETASTAHPEDERRLGQTVGTHTPGPHDDDVVVGVDLARGDGVSTVEVRAYDDEEGAQVSVADFAVRADAEELVRTGVKTFVHDVTLVPTHVWLHTGGGVAGDVVAGLVRISGYRGMTVPDVAMGRAPSLSCAGGDGWRHLRLPGDGRVALIALADSDEGRRLLQRVADTLQEQVVSEAEHAAADTVLESPLVSSAMALEHHREFMRVVEKDVGLREEGLTPTITREQGLAKALEMDGARVAHCRHVEDVVFLPERDFEPTHIWYTTWARRGGAAVKDAGFVRIVGDVGETAEDWARGRVPGSLWRQNLVGIWYDTSRGRGMRQAVEVVKLSEEERGAWMPRLRDGLIRHAPSFVAMATGDDADRLAGVGTGDDLAGYVPTHVWNRSAPHLDEYGFVRLAAQNAAEVPMTPHDWVEQRGERRGAEWRLIRAQEGAFKLLPLREEVARRAVAELASRLDGGAQVEVPVLDAAQQKAFIKAVVEEGMLVEGEPVVTEISPGTPRQQLLERAMAWDAAEVERRLKTGPAYPGSGPYVPTHLWYHERAGIASGVVLEAAGFVRVLDGDGGGFDALTPRDWLDAASEPTFSREENGWYRDDGYEVRLLQLDDNERQDWGIRLRMVMAAAPAPQHEMDRQEWFERAVADTRSEMAAVRPGIVAGDHQSRTPFEPTHLWRVNALTGFAQAVRRDKDTLGITPSDWLHGDSSMELDGDGIWWHDGLPATMLELTPHEQGRARLVIEALLRAHGVKPSVATRDEVLASLKSWSNPEPLVIKSARASVEKLLEELGRQLPEVEISGAAGSPGEYLADFAVGVRAAIRRARAEEIAAVARAFELADAEIDDVDEARKNLVEEVRAEVKVGVIDAIWAAFECRGSSPETVSGLVDGLMRQVGSSAVRRHASKSGILRLLQALPEVSFEPAAVDPGNADISPASARQHAVESIQAALADAGDEKKVGDAAARLWMSRLLELLPGIGFRVDPQDDSLTAQAVVGHTAAAIARTLEEMRDDVSKMKAVAKMQAKSKLWSLLTSKEQQFDGSTEALAEAIREAVTKQVEDSVVPRWMGKLLELLPGVTARIDYADEKVTAHGATAHTAATIAQALRGERQGVGRAVEEATRVMNETWRYGTGEEEFDGSPEDLAVALQTRGRERALTAVWRGLGMTGPAPADVGQMVELLRRRRNTDEFDAIRVGIRRKTMAELYERATGKQGFDGDAETLVAQIRSEGARRERGAIWYGLGYAESEPACAADVVSAIKKVVSTSQEVETRWKEILASKMEAVDRNHRGALDEMERVLKEERYQARQREISASVRELNALARAFGLGDLVVENDDLDVVAARQVVVDAIKDHVDGPGGSLRRAVRWLIGRLTSSSRLPALDLSLVAAAVDEPGDPVKLADGFISAIGAMVDAVTRRRLADEERLLRALRASWSALSPHLVETGIADAVALAEVLQAHIVARNIRQRDDDAAYQARGREALVEALRLFDPERDDVVDADDVVILAERVRGELGDRLRFVPATREPARADRDQLADRQATGGRVALTVSHGGQKGDATISINTPGFTTIRPCGGCGVLISGGPTRCLGCASRLERDGGEVEASVENPVRSTVPEAHPAAAPSVLRDGDLIGLQVRYEDRDGVVTRSNAAGYLEFGSVTGALRAHLTGVTPTESPQNLALLSQSLLVIANRKNNREGEGWARGVAACGISDKTLRIYEAGYRDALYPRWWWQLPGDGRDTRCYTLYQVLLAELASTAFLGGEDRRPATTVQDARDAARAAQRDQTIRALVGAGSGEGTEDAVRRVVASVQAESATDQARIAGAGFDSVPVGSKT